MLRWSNVRSVTRFSQRRTYTTANTSPKSAAVEKNSENVNDKQTRADTSSAEQSKLVNAAFASLQQISFKSKFRKSSLVEVEETLNSAQDIDSLLSIANEPFIAKRNALRVRNKQFNTFGNVNYLICSPFSHSGGEYTLRLGSKR